MTTISSTRMAPMQPALSLLQSGLGSSAAGADAGGLLGHGPATKVSLSDDAKSIMARARAEQKVADQLRSYLDASQGRGRGKTKPPQPEDAVEFSAHKGAAAKNEADPGAEILAKYGHLGGAKHWAALARADNIGIMKEAISSMDFDGRISEQRRLDAGEAIKRQRIPTPDEQWAESTQNIIAKKYIELVDSGKSAEAERLRQAVQNGAITVQKAEDVTELHMKREHYHFGDAGKWGGTSGSFTVNPTGKIKEAIHQGRALSIDGIDRGAFYMSWT